MWWYMLVPVEIPVVCTWTMGTFAAAAGIAEPTKADPATPSARIAGIMKARPMRMTPPPQLLGLAGQAAPQPPEEPEGAFRWGYTPIAIVKRRERALAPFVMKRKQQLKWHCAVPEIFRFPV